jgi:predicted GNAT family N-acyltransferase
MSKPLRAFATAACSVTWLSPMHITRLSTDQAFYEQALDLRHRLFFEEFDLPKGIEKDELESQSIHFGMTNNQSLLAYGRLTNLDSATFKISQVVVAPSKQRQGHGTALLKHIISYAQSNGASSIELNSQVTATPIYSSLGFKEIGAHYSSKTTGIPHVKMVLGSAT